MATDALRRTALYDSHVRCGARLVPFAGYEMPVQYTSIIAESLAVRREVGMFDVSHMARLRLRGERVLEFVEWVSANDASKLEDGRGQYSLLPNERGGTVDDIIVYRVTAEEFLMVVNAANHAKDVAWLESQNAHGVRLDDETERTAMIAVQGPRAVDVLARLATDGEALRAAPPFGLVTAQIAGVPCVAGRSGYTGEDGFEVICDAERGPRLWEALLAEGVTPCGLGARDVLRVEAGLPLYGHELTDDLSPIAAGLGWVISKTKAFVGSEIVNEARRHGTPRRIQGIKLASKRIPAPAAAVRVDGRERGQVTSGVYSPLLECGIGFALLDADVEVGTPCTVDLRGKEEPGEVVAKRFYKRK